MWAPILQTISAVVAAATFVYGVGAWRRTVVGQRRIELAVEAIVAFREVEQAFREIRSPIGYQGEGSTRQGRPGESERDKEVGERAFVAIERMNARSEKFSILEGVRHRFAAYFGTEALKPFDEARAIRIEIARSAWRLENYWKQQGQEFRTDEALQKHLRDMEKFEAIFWEGTQEPDPLNTRIEKMVDDIDELCREVIGSKVNFWKSLRRFRAGWKSFWAIP